MIRTHIFLPDVFLKALKRLKEKTGLPIAEHIRRAIDEYLNKNK